MRETKFYDIKYINFRRRTVVHVYEKYIICRSVRVQIFLYEHFVSLANIPYYITRWYDIFLCLIRAGHYQILPNFIYLYLLVYFIYPILFVAPMLCLCSMLSSYLCLTRVIIKYLDSGFCVTTILYLLLYYIYV